MLGRSTQGVYRFGVLEWSVSQASLAVTCLAPFEAIAQWRVVVPFLRAVGNRSAFEIGLLCSALAYAILGLSAFGGEPGRLRTQHVALAGLSCHTDGAVLQGRSRWRSPTSSGFARCGRCRVPALPPPAR